MDKENELKKKIAELQNEWDNLCDKISKLNRKKILETRIEEKWRLEQDVIPELEEERKKIEKELDELEAQLQSIA